MILNVGLQEACIEYLNRQENKMKFTMMTVSSKQEITIKMNFLF